MTPQKKWPSKSSNENSQVLANPEVSISEN